MGDGGVEGWAMAGSSGADVERRVEEGLGDGKGVLATEECIWGTDGGVWRWVDGGELTKGGGAALGDGLIERGMQWADG